MYADHPDHDRYRVRGAARDLVAREPEAVGFPTRDEARETDRGTVEALARSFEGALSEFEDRASGLITVGYPAFMESVIRRTAEPVYL